MHREVHRSQVGCGGLLLIAIGLNGAAYTAPDVDLVRQFERNLKVVDCNAVKRRAVRLTVGGRFGADCGRGGGHSWKKIGPMVAEQRASLGVLGFGGFQVLVGDVDLSFEGIELRILKSLPPVAAEILVIWLGRFPVAHLFISWRDLCCRAVIFWTHCTTGNGEHAGDTDDSRSALPNSNRRVRVVLQAHWPPPAPLSDAVFAICTCCPVRMESGGF